jgi:hypothetical protein
MQRSNSMQADCLSSDALTGQWLLLRLAGKQEEEDSAADLPRYFRLPRTYGEALS